MAYSRVVEVGDGTTTQFAVNFALDYLLETDVRCRVGTEIDGSGNPLYRPITFLSTNLIQVSGDPAGEGVEVLFERIVDKTLLRVDYSNGDQLDEDNLMIAQKQTMMAVHEALDTVGVVDEYIDGLQTAIEQVTLERIAAQTAQTGAETAASGAGVSAAAANTDRLAVEALASSIVGDQASRAFAQTSYHPESAPEFLFTAGYYSAGDGGGALYKANGTTTGDLVLTLEDGTTLAGYDVSNNLINSKMFGAKWDGTTNDTVAVQKVMNDLRPVNEPIGTCLIDTIYVPDSQGKTFLGSGRATIFKANGNARLFTKATTGGVVQGGTFGDFTVCPKTGGVSSAAIYLSGFRHAQWQNVRGVDDTATGGFRALFNLAASPYLCYACRIVNPELDNKRGYLFGIEFDNGGTNSATYNANCTQIVNPWFCNCADLLRGIDLRRSGNTTILGGLIEQNPSAIGLDMGQSAVVIGLWQEVNGFNFQFKKGTDGGVGNDCLIIGCYGQATENLFIDNPSGNVFLFCRGIDEGAWTGNAAGDNLKIKMNASAEGQPTIPTVTYMGGEGGAGNLSVAAATVTKAMDQLTRRYAVRLYYTWSPSTASSNTQFTISTPANYTLTSFSVGCHTAAGLPCPSAISVSGQSFWVDNQGTDQRISVYAEYTRNAN